MLNYLQNLCCHNTAEGNKTKYSQIKQVKLDELHCIRDVCDCDSEYAVAVFNNCSSGMNSLIVKQIKI